MSCIKQYVLKQSLFLGLLILSQLLTLSCTEGVNSGTLLSHFAGVQKATVLSPTSVRLEWKRSSDDIDYTIYMGGNSDPLRTTTLESVTIDELSPNTAYKFKVVAKTTSGSLGDDREISVSTWPSFSGISKLSKDEEGNFILQWNYPYPVKRFLVFYKIEKVPTAVNTQSWATPDITSNDQQVKFRDWQGASNYYFTVHAEYDSGEFDRPNVVLDALANPNFPTSNIVVNVPNLTIGSLPIISVSPQIDANHPASNYTCQLFQGDTPISDPQPGAANLVVLPNVNLSLGIVDDLNVHITYNDGTINQTLIKKGYSTIIKDQSSILDLAPVNTSSGGPGFIGKSMVTGDFNCDGVDDLAVGIPDSSIASLGMTNSFAGVVYVYYSKKFSNVCGNGCNEWKLYTPALGAPLPSIGPANPGEDPQIIAIADMPINSHFGASLSKGNLNGDGVVNGGFKRCEDLVVGAPGMQGSFDPTASYSSSGQGSAFVFFGSAQGLKSPTSLANISENISTCDGSFTGATCNAVRLWARSSIYKVQGITQSQSTLDGLPVDAEFGKSVAFIGDINGDGYDDLAVGAPNDPWNDRFDDGTATNGTYLYGAGSVTIYFGSKYGIGLGQISQVSSTYPADCTSSSQNGCARAIKVYSPNPTSGESFGSAIFGGVDVDGRKGPQSLLYTPTELTSKCTAQPPNVCYSTSDFIVGAPGGGLFKPTGGLGFSSYNGVSNPVRYIAPINSDYGSALDTDWTSSPKWNTSFGPNGTSWGAISLFGFTTGSGKPTSITGVSYLYFGMTDADISPDNYFSCSKRYDSGNLGGYGGSGGLSALKHFSCFTNGKNIRYLYPRDNSTSGFGSSVALLGKKAKLILNYGGSLWEEVSTFSLSSTLQVPHSDPNMDGFGDIIVGAPNSNNNTGLLWEYFGNPSREFDSFGLKAAFSNISSPPSSTVASSYFQSTAPNCTSFDTTSVNADNYRYACRPTLIKLNSFSVGSRVGNSQNSMAVGDINGDGLKDILVGAPYDSSNGTNSGLIYIFTSIKSGAVAKGIGPSNYKVSKSGGAGIQLGSSVAAGAFEDPVSPSHLRADGITPYISVVAGAPNDPMEKSGGGAVHLYKTNYNDFIGGSVPTESLVDKMTSFQDLEFQSTRIVGDINNDGYDDAVGHIYYFDTQGNRVYQAFVYFGSPIGLISTEFCKNNLTRVFTTGSDASECFPKTFHNSSGTNTGIILPQLVSAPNGVINSWAKLQIGVGDVNGDGFDDVLFYDPTTRDGVDGNMVLYFGSSVGLNSINAPSFSPVSTGDPQIITSNYELNVDNPQFLNKNDHFLRDLVVHGDFNGDGFEDVAIGNPFSRAPNFGAWPCADISDPYCPGGGGLNYFGRVLILYGSALGYQTPRLKDSLANDFLPIPLNAWVNVNGYLYDPYDPLLTGTGSEHLSSNNVVANSFACTLTDCKPTILWNPIDVKKYVTTGIYGGISANVDAPYNKFNHRFGASLSVLKPVLGGSGDSKFDSLVIGAPDYIDPGCFASTSTSDLRTGRAYVFYGSDYGIRAFNRDEYYFGNPGSSSFSVSCWASPPATATITKTTPSAPGNELKFHQNEDLRNRVIVLSPPPKFGGGAVSSYNGKSRRFGEKLVTAGDLNADGVEDLVISDGGRGNFLSGVYGQGWVYYGNLCDVENATNVWSANANDDPLNPKRSVSGTKATFSAQGKTYADECYVNENSKKFLPHTFSVKGFSVSNKDVYFSSLKSGRSHTSNFNNDGIDGFDDVVIGSQTSNDSISNSDSLGNGMIFFGSNQGLISDEIPQTFMSTSAGSSLLFPLYRPFKIIPRFKINKARFFDSSLSTGDVNGDKAMDLLVPSSSYSGTGSNKGVELGAFMLFY